MKDWVDARATARAQGLRARLELYVQRPVDRRTLATARPTGRRCMAIRKLRPSVNMSDVDTVEGPPSSEHQGLRGHDRRRSRADPSESRLSADGDRALARDAVRRSASARITGAPARSFHLEKGVNAIVFERMTRRSTTPTWPRSRTAGAPRGPSKARGCAVRSNRERGPRPDANRRAGIGGADG